MAAGRRLHNRCLELKASEARPFKRNKGLMDAAILIKGYEIYPDCMGCKYNSLKESTTSQGMRRMHCEISVNDQSTACPDKQDIMNWQKPEIDETFLTKDGVEKRFNGTKWEITKVETQVLISKAVINKSFGKDSIQSVSSAFSKLGEAMNRAVENKWDEDFSRIINGESLDGLITGRDTPDFEIEELVGSW